MSNPMDKLREYVNKNTERGACKCGKCFDGQPNPENDQPKGHTADLVFFQVAALPEASKDEFLALVKESKAGEFCDVNLLDGKEHGYFELGGWIGDQGTALMLMGLGAVLGAWKLMTPKMLPGLPDALVNQMAGSGMITIQA